MMQTQNSYDVIVILCGGIKDDGSLTEHQKQLVELGVHLVEEGAASNLAICGGYGYKVKRVPDILEAKAYKSYALTLGMSDQHVFIETDSKDTLGNAYFLKVQILLPHNWKNLLVIPSINHTNARVNYVLQKVLGSGYSWDIRRANENTNPENLAREERSLALTKEINDVFTDGDHEAIYKGMRLSHLQ
jgi:uncharacterized SAM-binding protein YcdF (DUF218 family)